MPLPSSLRPQVALQRCHHIAPCSDQHQLEVLLEIWPGTRLSGLVVTGVRMEGGSLDSMCFVLAKRKAMERQQPIAHHMWCVFFADVCCGKAGKALALVDGCITCRLLRPWYGDAETAFFFRGSAPSPSILRATSRSREPIGSIESHVQPRTALFD